MNEYETRPERLIRELIESMAIASPDVVALTMPQLPDLPLLDDEPTAWW